MAESERADKVSQKSSKFKTAFLSRPCPSACALFILFLLRHY